MKTIYTINELAEQWSTLACHAMCDSPIDGELFRELACGSFEWLSMYDDDETIPKSIADLLIIMADFAAYSLIDMDTQGFNPQIMHTIVVTMLCQFVNGFKNCGSEYPKLKLSDDLNTEYLNFETADLYKLFFMDNDLPF